MHEDFLHCLEEEHANDKKIVFEYPENDLDGTETTQKNKKITTKKVTEKTVNEDTDELATEIVDEELEENIEEEYIDDEEYEEPKKKNTLLVALASFFLLLLITGGIIWLVSTQEVEDVTVPDVVGFTYDEAVKKLKEAGFKIDSDTQNSDTVEEGLIIKTKPKAGSTRKKGDTIIIIESSGGVYNYLENYVGLKYAEVKAKLELLGINVIIEKKDIEDKEKYKEKEDIIIEQSPKFDENKDKVLLEKGDTITLYIPNIVDEYPDMVNEGWTLSDVIAFSKEYKLNLTVYDSSKNLIPPTEYDKYKNTKVIYQEREVGDTIIEGFNLQVDINVQYTPETEAPSSDPNVSE